MTEKSVQTHLKSHKKTADKGRDTKERLVRAFMTLRALPSSQHTRPMGHKSAWPDMIRPAKKRRYLTPWQFEVMSK